MNERHHLAKINTHCLMAVMDVAEMTASFQRAAGALGALNQAIGNMTEAAMDEASVEAQMMSFKPYP